MKRSTRRSASNNLSLDSLIDVFMNVLGILIISAIAIALSPQQDTSPDVKTAKTKEPVKSSSKSTRTATVYLPSQEVVSTVPLYIYIDRDGIRPIDIVNDQGLSKYFSVVYNGDVRKLTPLEGITHSKKDLPGLLENISGFDRHIVMLVKPEGVRHYKWVRTVAGNLGIRSGWTPFAESEIIIGPGGRSMNVVQ